MRLNSGVPVWHASLSIWTPDGRMVSSPGVAERAGVRLLAGVGNEREWWVWRSDLAVGHLRVGLSAACFGRRWPLRSRASPLLWVAVVSLSTTSVNLLAHYLDTC